MPFKPPPPDPSCLTPEERQLLSGLARGYNNQQLAKQIGVRKEDIEKQLQSISGKLDLAERLGLALYAVSYKL